MKTLILGGARSGKSGLAQRRAQATGRPVTLIATAQALDAEMAERIARHQADRPPSWRTVEEPLALAAALKAECATDRCVIVDCLTLWLTNLLLDSEARLAAETTALLNTLPDLPGEILLVANETGLGVVPADVLSRRYVDVAGWLHQSLAQACDRVVLTVAGLPVALKG